MIIKTEVKRGSLTPQTGSDKSAIPVQFNPVSLQYSITNTLKEEGKGKQKKQVINQASAKLTMDLVFDNTHDGKDVRNTTNRIALLMDPAEGSSDAKKKTAKVVLFEWGAFKFQGMIESYKETLDFFSGDGVPLRSSVNLSLVQQDKIFEPGTSAADKSLPQGVDVPNADARDATSRAAQGGDPNAGRALAASNGLESMRFPSGPAINVGASVQLGGAVAFASGGAGISASAGFGISAGAGFGISAGAGLDISGGAGFGIGGSAGFDVSGGAGFDISGGPGFGISGGAGFGVSAGAGFGTSAGFAIEGPSFGSSASAGVSFSDGAFAGLGVTTTQTSFSLDTDSFLVTSESVSLVTDSDATFEVGGVAGISGSASLRADVGASADLSASIQFDD
jgi:hypothetical protein